MWTLQNCTVEDGYLVSPLNGKVQQLPLSPGLLLDELAAGASYEGTLRFYPLPVSDNDGSEIPTITTNSFGWADAFVVPAAPGSVAAVVATATFRGIYKYGPLVSNDASSDPEDAAGDAFTCPCPAETAAAIADAALGVPLRDITLQSGTLSEAEGVYVHDGVSCEWKFGYSDLLHWTVIQFIPTVPYASDLLSTYTVFERLTASAITRPPLDTQSVLGCYFAPCNLYSIAATETDALLFLPSNILFQANSTRALRAHRPQGTGGRFSISFQQYSGISAAMNSRGVTQSKILAKTAVLSKDRNVVGMRIGYSGAEEDGAYSFDDKNRAADSGVPDSGPLILALSAVQSVAAPCRFAQGPTNALLRFDQFLCTFFAPYSKHPLLRHSSADEQMFLMFLMLFSI